MSNTATQRLSLADIRRAINFKQARGEQLSIDEIGNIADVDKAENDEQVRSCAAVLRNTPLAGSAAERAANVQAYADAEARLADESPKIAAQIAELQSELASLERNVKTSAALVEAQTRAVDALRKCVPPHVAKFHATSVQLFKQNFGRLRELKSRVSHIKQLIAIDIAGHEGVDAAKRHCEQHAKELLDCERHANSTFCKVNPQRWATYITQLRAELASGEPELAELQAAQNAGIAKLDDLLNVYVPA